MKCRFCGCYQEPKDNWRSILVAFTFALLVGFLGGLFFSDWKIIPRFEQKIEKDRTIKEELQKGYLPSKGKIDLKSK